MTAETHQIDLQAYFERVGFAGTPEPTRELLETLVKLHMAVIPFEAIDVMLGRGVDLAPETVDRKLLAHHRGGYCFEHTSLMRRTLEAIGFPVKQHLARVWINGNPETDPARPATHTSLKVEADGAHWLVDVGFGGFTPNAPLAWQTDTPSQTDFGAYRLTATRDGLLLESRHDAQWLPLYEILDFNWQPADFKVSNHYSATHPDAHFQDTLMVSLTKPEGRLTLAGNCFKRASPDGTREEQDLDAEELAEVLSTAFGLPVADDWLPLLQQIAAAARG